MYKHIRSICLQYVYLALPFFRKQSGPGEFGFLGFFCPIRAKSEYILSNPIRIFGPDDFSSDFTRKIRTIWATSEQVDKSMCTTWRPTVYDTQHKHTL